MSKCVYSQEQYDKVIEERNELANEVLILKDKLKQSEQETLHFHNKYFAEKQIAREELIKVKGTLVKFLQDNGFYESEWYDLFEEIDQQIKELEKDE